MKREEEWIPHFEERLKASLEQQVADVHADEATEKRLVQAVMKDVTLRRHPANWWERFKVFWHGETLVPLPTLLLGVGAFATCIAFTLSMVAQWIGTQPILLAGDVIRETAIVALNTMGGGM